MPILVVLAAAAASLSLPVVWWAVSGDRSTIAGARNLQAGAGRRADLRDAVLARSASDRAVRPLVQRLAGRARRFTPQGLYEGLEHRMLLAGAPAAWPMERLLAAKLVLGGTGVVVALFRFVASPSASALVFVALLAAAGYFLPDFLLYNRAAERQKQIALALPDTLDQITIAVEAGLGFEQAMARAGQTGAGPLAEELLRTLQDVQAGMSRAQALRRLVERTSVPDLRRFVLALLQADSYGVPMGRVLRVQAKEQRVKRRQRAEERAMKIPVKVIFPLIFCILPALFVVILGPGILRISGSVLGGGG